MKRNIQEQKSDVKTPQGDKIDVKLSKGDILVNNKIKYELRVKTDAGIFVPVDIKKLTPSDKSWEITAGVDFGIFGKKERTSSIPQNSVDIITKKILGQEKKIDLKDAKGGEYQLKLVEEENIKKVIKLTESDLNNLVRKVLEEQREENYMFFSNLEQMRRQIDMLLELDPGMVDEIIQNGHDWADDHISEAKTNMDQVFDFLMNETRKMKSYIDYEDINEGKKKSGTKLCSRGKSAAKAKFKVYPSAYANGYAVQVCKGDMPGLDGKKHCSGSYC